MPLVSCGICGLAFVVHNLSTSEINSFYDADDYFDSEYAGDGALSGYEANRLEQEKKAKFALDVIRKYNKGGSLLEIGCAGGYFLKLAEDKYNFKTKGVEISRHMSSFGNKKLGLNIYCGTIDNVPREWQNFDVIYMGDVLEHTSEPLALINKVKSRMKVGGIVCLELPLTYNWTFLGLLIGLTSMIKGKFGKLYFLPSQHRTRFIAKPPYHLLMFTKSAIKYFLEHNGFSVQYVKVYEGKPKVKFNAYKLYALLKTIFYFISTYLPQNTFGDRMIVIARLESSDGIHAI
jgi:2-polyprenyl-3-methyl-5-hydroxy-6-metoxy-1,4-benzoquinol methylase